MRLSPTPQQYDEALSIDVDERLPYLQSVLAAELEANGGMVAGGWMRAVTLALAGGRGNARALASFAKQWRRERGMPEEGWVDETDGLSASSPRRSSDLRSTVADTPSAKKTA